MRYIRNCHIKKKQQYIFIKFPAFRSAAVVPTQLVPTVHSTHKPIVEDDTCWARHFYDASVPLLPADSATAGRLTVCGHDRPSLSCGPSKRSLTPFQSLSYVSVIDLYKCITFHACICTHTDQDTITEYVFECVCNCLCIYTYTHSDIHTHTHTRTDTDTQTHTHKNRHKDTPTHRHRHIHLCIIV